MIGISLIWPGDIPFINDEARLIANALDANERGRLASLGLKGTAGIHYGPIPTWFYQACLLLTKNLIVISVIKNTACSISLFLIVVLLSREINYPKFPILILFVSPYLYFLNRSLWDNTFTIVFSTLLYLLFISFHRNRSVMRFYLCLSLIVVLIHIELKSVFSIIAFIAAFTLFEHKWVFANWRQNIAGVLVAGVVSYPYMTHVFSNVSFDPQFKVSYWKSLEAGLTGIKFFSFFDWGDYYLPELYVADFPLSPVVATALTGISYLSFVFFFLGAIEAGKALFRKIKYSETFDEGDKLAILCATAIGIYVVFLLIVRHRHHPQALVGVWFPYFYFLWRCFCVNRHILKKVTSFWIYFTAMGTLLTHLILVIHINGGNRGPYYGATLRNQINVITKMLSYSPQSKVVINVQNYRLFPHTFHTLIKVASFRKHHTHSEKPVKHLLIDYENPFDLADGHISLTASDKPFSGDNPIDSPE